ncbi:hypothetical protein LSCM4_03409 [Leishmania orientalis]|uniref:Uncharacterized protein n=1 Tax=Leishmania orientalis TaxID=2249476 RepID=A0A836H6H1_9TRYP|nr:hypothetical protein LSCM4_03409 [Leishmania orientalis]
MEELAKSVQQAQAAVLGVQNDLALLRAHVEKDVEERDACYGSKAGAVGLETGVVLTNPYYVELHTTVHQRQEAASLLLQRCAHLFYEQFGALEEKAVRLENVRVKEKELQSAKKSMQRYFDAHTKLLSEERDSHDGALRLEWERREHLEDGILRVKGERRRQRLVHGVLLMWVKKAVLRSVTRECTRQGNAARERYQSAACDALLQQQRVTAVQRALLTWRARMLQRRCQRLKAVATEAEKRAQFFRKELATAQKTVQERLDRDVVEHHRIATAAATQEKECAQYEDGVQRLRTALRDMTVEFSERTRTYVRQQEGLEQLFAQKEAALRNTICSLQAMLTAERHAHVVLAESSRHFFSHVQAYWQAQLQELAEAVRRKEEYAHHTILGLTGRLQHRLGSLVQEAAKLARDVNTLAPLSERCVRLENALAESELLLKRSKASSQSWERRCKAASVVESLLTDRVASAASAALRAQSFIRWLGYSHTASSERFQRRIDTLSDKLQTQRRMGLAEQQKQSSHHQAAVAQLCDELEELRRANVRLQSEQEAALRMQRERDGAYFESEARNGELSAAMLREKMERRGVEDKWWSSRASGLMLQEARQRLQVEAQEGQWWTTLLLRESKMLKVWTASLSLDAAQLTAVCEGWQQHCQQLDAAHVTVLKTLAMRTARALERGALHTETLAVWTSWREWARRRGAVAAAEARSSASRKETAERHGKEMARAHASHDRALQRLQSEYAQEKTQLQSIHQERCASLRRVQAEEVAQLSERHVRQLKIVQTAYAADIAQRDEQAASMQAQLNHIGSLLVEYCAQATYRQWRAWAADRQAQRTARQRCGLITRLLEWYAVRTTMVDTIAAAKAALWTSTAIELARECVAEAREQVQRLTQEEELCQSQQHKLKAAKEAAEEEATHLRGELHHVRTLYDAEAHYTERLLRAAAEERRTHRSTLTFSTRMTEWQELAHSSFAEHQAAAMEAFISAVGRCMAEASVTRRAETTPNSAQREAAAWHNAFANKTILSSAGEAVEEKGHTFGGGSVLGVSGRAPRERAMDTDGADVLTDADDDRCLSTRALAVTPPLVQVVPEVLLSRLEAMERYVRAAGGSREAEGDVDTASSEQCGHLLAQPFLETLVESSPQLTAAGSRRVELADVPLAVLRLLELVRLAALRGAAAHLRERATELAATEAKRARSEEALVSLRESMEGLLEEQRSLTGEMHADAQQQQQYLSSREAGSEQASLVSTETWQERLSALTSRYARVLEAFHDGITRRQETFYSVNGILVEVDEFSESLLQRFAENVREMAQLQRQLVSESRAEAARHPGDDGPDAGSPAHTATAVRERQSSSPEPGAPSPPLTPSLPPVALDNAFRAASAPRSTSSATTSALGLTSFDGSPPEKRGLRDRVHLLEKLLVETKVQLAEAKSLAGVAHRAASLAKASAQAHVWAAQDVEDFSQLALTKEQLLVLYGASESTTRTLMTAMREYGTQLRDMQAEVTGQLRTACAAVGETLQARHRVDVEVYEAKVRTLSESVAAAAKEQSAAEARHEELERQLKSEMASWVETYTRDIQLIRQSCLSKIDELADHQRLLEDELQQYRCTAQSSVQQAVDRQTELLELEHAEQLRRSQRNVARLLTEKALVEDRLRAAMADGELRVQQERAAVARLQHLLVGGASADADVACMATLAGWDLHLLGSAELYARCAEDKAVWFAACAAGLMEQEREKWETEVVQLRERMALLLGASGAAPAAPASGTCFYEASANLQEGGRNASPQDKAEEDSSQELTLSPSPRRSHHGVPAGEGGARIAVWDAGTQRTPRRAVSSPAAARASCQTQCALPVGSPGTTPTRHRSLSVDSLELSQSFLRYSKMLSEQRTRNATRLERASALAAEVDDLLLRGALLGHSAASQKAR